MSRAFTVYVALNMLVCAVVFLPWALPRETISGLLGRWRATEFGFKQEFAMVAAQVVDRLYYWDVNHCAEVYRMERDARMALYPSKDI